MAHRNGAATRKFNRLTQRLNSARQAIIVAKMERQLTVEEHLALDALQAYMSAATAAPGYGLLKMAERLAEMDRVSAKINRLLRLARLRREGGRCT